jgi:hypothetical protein
MKPTGPFESEGFPKTNYFFQSGFGHWHGHSFPYDGDDDSDVRRFHSFSREFLRESARERTKEMFVFALVVLAAAWPVAYMVISVVELLIKGRPLDH